MRGMASAWELMAVAMLATGLLAPIESASALAAGGPGIPGTLQSVTLPNGVRLVLAPDPMAAAVDVSVWVDAGLRYEPAHRNGIAHLVERMVAMGPAAAPAREHQRRIEALGGSTGSFTTGDYVCFFESIPAPALTTVLELEAARMGPQAFDAARLDAARQGIVSERQQPDQNSPLATGVRVLVQRVYGEHPYHAPVTGQDADLRATTLNDVQDWMRARYTPKRTVVTIAGRFDAAEATALARRTVGELKGGGGGSTPPMPVAQVASRRSSQPSLFPFPMLLAGWAIPGRTDPDLPALLVLSSLLARGDGSRLDAELIQHQQLGFFIESDVEVRREASLFYVALGVQPGADTSTVERALIGAIGDAAGSTPSAQELERAIKQLENGMLFSWQSARGRGQALGTAAMLAGDPQDATRLLERVHAVTAADVKRVAAKHLTEARRNIVWLMKRPDDPNSGRRGAR